MRCALVSDLHLEFTRCTPSAEGADVVIAAGDILPLAQGNAVEELSLMFKGQRVIFVPGNHDYWGETEDCVPESEALWRATGKKLGVDVLVEDTVEIGGIRFAGTPLFSDLSLAPAAQRHRLAMMLEAQLPDFHIMRSAPYEPWTVDSMVQRAKKSQDFLKKVLPATVNEPHIKTVVVTHWVPTEHSIDPRYDGDAFNPYFTSQCDDLVARADVWCHGHTHADFDYVLPGTKSRVLCHPRGYTAENGWKEVPHGDSYEPVFFEV